MLWTTRSAVAVRLTTFSVALLRADVPRPSGSEPVSCRYTGHASSQVFTIRTVPPPAPSGTPTTGGSQGAVGALLRLPDDGPEEDPAGDRQHQPPDQQPHPPRHGPLLPARRYTCRRCAPVQLTSVPRLGRRPRAPATGTVLRATGSARAPGRRRRWTPAEHGGGPPGA